MSLVTESTDQRDLPDTIRVLVVVGTDHHAFDRLVEWVDQWALARGLEPDEVLVQHGTARAPANVRGRQMLPYRALVSLMERADAVVIQGGPATLADARRAGRLPICVPREPALNEHVDGHQKLFARRMDAAGLMRSATTEEEFARLLDEAVSNPDLYRIPVTEEGRMAAVDEVGRIISRLIAHQPRNRRRRTRGQ